MKKYTLVLIVFAMTLLVGFSGERAQDTAEASEGAKAQVEAKEPVEASIAAETQIVCDEFSLVERKEIKATEKAEIFLDKNPGFEMEIKNKIHDLREQNRVTS